MYDIPGYVPEYTVTTWRGMQVQYVMGLCFGMFDLKGNPIIMLDKSPENIPEIVRLLVELGARPVAILNAVA